jgi:hypothetical protein
MYASVTTLPARRALSLQRLLFSALFWLFTYVLLSVRAQMLLGDGFDLLSTRRLLGTSAGALAYWAVLGLIRTGRDGRPVNPAAIVATILPATIFVLAACLAVEHLWYESPLPLQATLRWVMAWSGYFGLWVSASLAFQIHRDSRTVAPAFAPASIAGPAPATRPAPADPAAWDWLVEACAAELAELPAPDRTALVARLVAKAGYEQADDPGGVANARVELAGRIASRLTAPPAQGERKG